MAPILKVHDNFLNKTFEFKPVIYISHDGRLVISYESEPMNYRDFGDTEETYKWNIGDENHLTWK